MKKTGAISANPEEAELMATWEGELLKRTYLGVHSHPAVNAIAECTER